MSSGLSFWEKFLDIPGPSTLQAIFESLVGDLAMILITQNIIS